MTNSSNKNCIFVVCIVLTFAIAIVSSAPPPSAAKLIQMRCLFTTDYHFGSSLQNIYTCEISGSLQVTRRTTVITSIDGNHTQDRGNDDVQGFKADAAIIKYFPKGLDRIFRNFLAILINFSQLKEIKQENLRPFTKLKYLDLFENKIQYLEADLFKNNPNLEVIWLSNNEIKFIHESVFASLKKVKSLYLGYNQCISRSFADSPDKMAYMVELIAVQCGSKSPSAKTIPNTPTDDDYDDDNDDQYNPELDAAQSQLNQLKIQMQRIEDEVFHLKRKRENALMELSKYQDENRQLKAAQNDTSRKLTELQDKVKKMDGDGVGYIKQIKGLRDDMRKQIDATDGVVTDFKDELSLLKSSLTIERDEIARLKTLNDRRLSENLELHKEFEELQEKKRGRDMVSLIVIFLLAFVAVGAIMPMIFTKFKQGGVSLRSRSWNGFENVKMMNEEQVSVGN